MNHKLIILFFVTFWSCNLVFAQVELGKLAPEINLPSPIGKNISLKELKGNIILVDFWASWCAPCRASNPELLRIYEQYATNGFEIISISLDKDKDKWVSAIQQDKLSWEHQASDLKAWDSKVVVDYGVQALPTQFLIDREGKIVAIDLSLEELSDELEYLLINEAVIYPKKASSLVFINVFTKYEVKDANGKKVKKGLGNEIDVANLPNGKYTIEFENKSYAFEKVTSQDNNLDFYPKNASTSIKINKAVLYEVSNLKGETVLSGSGSEIDISKLHIGVYYLNMGGFVGKFLKK